jgi:FkbM family methyltransferase
MLKLLKKNIKLLFHNYGFILKKNYANRKYTNSPPDQETLNQIFKSSGIIHMGAHRGTEAPVYDWFNKKTIWIEANPDIFLDLKINISQFINQKAFNCLLYDKDNVLVDFYLSNNDAASSSLFKFSKKYEDIKMIKQKKLKTLSLDTLLEKNSIDAREYNFWVMDLQGAEYLALKGSTKSIKFCDAILIEISKDEYYLDGAKWEDIRNFLNNNMMFHFKEPDNMHQDVLFIRKYK